MLRNLLTYRSGHEEGLSNINMKQILVDNNKILDITQRKDRVESLETIIIQNK